MFIGKWFLFGKKEKQFNTQENDKLVCFQPNLRNINQLLLYLKWILHTFTLSNVLYFLVFTIYKLSFKTNYSVFTRYKFIDRYIDIVKFKIDVSFSINGIWLLEKTIGKNKLKKKTFKNCFSSENKMNNLRIRFFNIYTFFIVNALYITLYFKR